MVMAQSLFITLKNVMKEAIHRCYWPENGHRLIWLEMPGKYVMQSPYPTGHGEVGALVHAT